MWFGPGKTKQNTKKRTAPCIPRKSPIQVPTMSTLLNVQDQRRWGSFRVVWLWTLGKASIQPLAPSLTWCSAPHSPHQPPSLPAGTRSLLAEPSAVSPRPSSELPKDMGGCLPFGVRLPENLGRGCPPHWAGQSPLGMAKSEGWCGAFGGGLLGSLSSLGSYLHLHHQGFHPFPRLWGACCP